MVQHINERLEYYRKLAGESNVEMEKLEVLRHPEMPNKYFIHAKFLLGKGGQYSLREVIETYAEDQQEWVLADIDMTNDLEGFLADCVACNF